MKIPLNQISHSSLEGITAHLPTIYYPVIVQVTSIGNYKLLYGQGAFLYCKQKLLKEIECIIVPKEVKEVVEEILKLRLNERRLDWWERIKLQKKFHDLKMKNDWSLRKTAEELDVCVSALSQNFKLLEYPEFRFEKSKSAAIRKIKKEMIK